MLNQKSQAVPGALLLLGGCELELPRHQLSRTNCASCGDTIPPGRPGRKCHNCRTGCTHIMGSLEGDTAPVNHHPDKEIPMPDDLCDLYGNSGVSCNSTTCCGKTIGVECGCADTHDDGNCNDPTCIDCNQDGDY